MKKARHIVKKIRALPKRLLPLTPWTIFFGALALVFCAEVSAIAIQHIHNTAKQVPATSSSTNPQTPNKFLVNPTTTPTQNTTTPTSSSSAGSTSSKSPAPSTSTPSVTAPSVNACDVGSTNDASARYTLAQAYLAEENYITIHVNDDSAAVEAHPTDATTAANAIYDLNSVISLANSQYAQSYNGYVSERHQYNCSVTVSAPAPIPLCTGTVADCISNINANEPTTLSW